VPARRKAASRQPQPAPRRIPARKRTDAVLVVGSVAFDELTTPEGDSGRILGGSASYAAFASSYFAPTQLVGVVGKDFGKHIERFRRRRIDLAGLQVNTSGNTFFWSGIYGPGFATTTTRDIQLNVFQDFSPTLPEAYTATPYIVLGNIQPQLQHAVLDQMHRRAFVAADTRDLWIENTRADLERLLPRLDLFVLNDDEARLMTGESNVILAGHKLRAQGPRSVIIKKGAHGSALFHPKGLFLLPAYPVTTLRDPTGAGDSYLGALVGHLAATGRTDFDALKTAIGYATVTASITVESFGPDGLEACGRGTINRRFATLANASRLP
jgi:sugar/nucleoside kinase (ribokinase family)